MDETVTDGRIAEGEEHTAQTSASPEAETDLDASNNATAPGKPENPASVTEGGEDKRKDRDEADPRGDQFHTRSENQDFMRVLHQFVRDLPQVYVENATVQGDMSLLSQGAAQPVPPPMRTTTEVPSVEIHKVKYVYQRHAAYPQALRVLQETRCVVLRGQPGVGKRSAAIKLALEVLPDGGTICEIAPDESLIHQIIDHCPQPGTVILVDGLLKSMAKDLSSHAARRILTALVRQKDYLIICVRPEIGLPLDLRHVDLKPTMALPDFLLELHLEYYGILDADERQRIVEAPEVAQLLEQEITPSQIDRIAQRLVETNQRGEPLQAGLSVFESVVKAEVEAWFDEVAEDLAEATFRIALAVFSGVSYPAIRRAGRDLLDRLQPKSESDDEATAESPAPSPFARPRISQRLAGARAKRTMHLVPKEYSDAAKVEVVELQDDQYTLILLHYLWTEFDGIRRPLLDWLCHYALRANQDLRVRAAGAIGALASLDFDYLASTVFRYWSDDSYQDNDERRRRYQALGSAMGVLVWDDNHADNVRGLLSAWIEDDNFIKRWAAARALGQFGLRYPREALRQWRSVLESEESVVLHLTDRLTLSVPHPLHMSVVDAVISLFSLAVEFPHSLRPIYEEAIAGLAAWVREDAENRHSQGAGLPLFLSLTAIGMPPDDGSGNPETWPPAMLYVAGTQPDSSYRRALAGLLRRAIRMKALRPHALEVLKKWIAFSDTEPWLQDVLELLLREMLLLSESTSRERGIVKVRLSRLATHPTRSSQTAQRLLKNLEL